MSYGLQSSVITVFAKLLPWSRWILRGTPYLKKKTFSKEYLSCCADPLVSGRNCLCEFREDICHHQHFLCTISNRVKSIVKTSRGLSARRFLMAGLDKVHLSHFFIHSSTSLCIPGQEKRSLIRCHVRSVPWWSIPSCKLVSTFSLSLLGRAKCFRRLHWGSWMTR